MHVLVRANGNAAWNRVASSDPQRIHTDGERWGTGVYTFKIKTNITVVTGQQVMIAYEFNEYYKDWRGPIPLSDFFMSAILVPDNTFINFGDAAFTSKVTLEKDDVIDFKSMQSVSGYKQQDFIKSIQNLFNFYFYTDSERPKHIYFEPYNDFYKQCLTPNIKANGLNWSDKFDYTEMKKKPFQQIYKNYKFQYKEDGDYLNGIIKNKYGTIYGNYTYTNAATSFTQDNNIELIFASTPLTTFEGSTRVLPLFFNYDTAGNKVPKQQVLRIMFYNGLKPTSAYRIGNWHDGNQYTVYESGLINYPQFHTTYDVTNSDLNFNTPDEVFYTYSDTPKYIYQQFYQNQITEYNDSNTVTVDAQILLSEIDISNLDFKKPIYFDAPWGDGYFKIISVNYSDNSSTSSITLQKIFLADSYALTTYYNEAITGYVSNPNCSGVSESVYINVPAGKYSSNVSQEIADADAQAEFDHTRDAVEDTGICINTDNVFHLTYSQTNVQACQLIPDDADYFTSTGTLGIGAVLFKKVGNNYIRCSLGYYSDTANWYGANQNGEINLTDSCDNVTLNSTVMAYGATRNSSCLNAENGMTLTTYYYIQYLSVGMTLYTDVNGNVPVSTAGFYSDAYFTYNVDATGLIIDALLC